MGVGVAVCSTKIDLVEVGIPVGDGGNGVELDTGVIVAVSVGKGDDIVSVGADGMGIQYPQDR